MIKSFSSNKSILELLFTIFLSEILPPQRLLTKVIQTLGEIPTRPLNVLWDCVQSTIHSAFPGLVVSDILSLCSLLGTTPDIYKFTLEDFRQILLNLFSGGSYGQAPQHLI